jgi:hypothetical protein
VVGRAGLWGKRPLKVTNQSGQPSLRNGACRLFSQSARLLQSLFYVLAVALFGHALSPFIYDGEAPELFV